MVARRGGFPTGLAVAGSIDVSGHTDKGVYIEREMDIYPNGSVDGYLYNPNRRSIYVEGGIAGGELVETDTARWRDFNGTQMSSLRQ